jgi:predicted metal-dependent phosphoesterase TrpH
MSNENDRSKQRADTARRHDDSELIEGMEPAPSQGGRSGHQINRDIGTQDEMKQQVGEGGITRVRKVDEGEDSDLPRFNESN